MAKNRKAEVEAAQKTLDLGSKKYQLELDTTHGKIRLDMYGEVAPGHVGNMLGLAKIGYYDGLTFHRIIKGFMIRGGCPEGSGSGGPGYTIRCEINEVPYERASVGMALSGKDTGGSQWFVTHSPQPHLDGGYTVFGRVIRGMEVVDRIARGDRIVRVVVNER